MRAPMILLAMLSVVLAQGAAAGTPVWPGPIHIEGDDDLSAENGVTGGNGTPDDPFVIGPWRLGPGAVHAAVHVGNITAAVRIEGIEIDGGGAARHGVHVIDVGELWLLNITVSNVGGGDRDAVEGVFVSGADRVVASDVQVTGSDGSGVWFQQIGRLEAESVVARDNTFHGIWVDEVRGGTMTGVVALRSGFNGLYFCGSDDVTVEASRFDDSAGMGADLTDSHRNTFRDNSFARNGQDGIKIIQSDETRLEGNSFIDNRRAAVSLVGSDGTFVADNVLSGNGGEIEGGSYLTPGPTSEGDAPANGTPAPGIILLLATMALARRFHA